MPKKPVGRTENTSPTTMPETAPNELYANYDIRIVMMKLGEIGAQVSDLRAGQKEISDKQTIIDEKLVRFDTTLKVGGVLLGAFLLFFWFMFGGDIKALRDLAVQTQAESKKAVE